MIQPVLNTRRHWRTRVILGLYFGGTALLVGITSLPASSLVRNSPFLPAHREAQQSIPKAAEPTNASEAKRFVLKGVSQIGSNYFFSIYDSVTQKGQWIQAGVAYNGFVIVKYEPAPKRIHFRWNGSDYTTDLPLANDSPIDLEFFTDHAPATGTGSGQSSQGHIAASRTIARSPGSPLPNNARLESSAKTSSASESVIVFNQRGSVTGSSNNFFNTPTGDLFASVEPLNTASQVQENAAPAKRYQVTRRNKVHNPSGKKPSHMGFAEWNALNQN